MSFAFLACPPMSHSFACCAASTRSNAWAHSLWAAARFGCLAGVDLLVGVPHQPLSRGQVGVLRRAHVVNGLLREGDRSREDEDSRADKNVSHVICPFDL